MIHPKRSILTLLLVAFLAAFLGLAPGVSAEFALLDDFEARTPGTIGGQGAWTLIGGNVDVVPNPGGDDLVPAGQVLKFHGNSASRGSLELPEYIPDWATATFFFRARFDSNSGNNFSMMTAQVANPVTSAETGHVATHLFAHNDAQLRAFSGATHNPLAPYAVEQWYSIWFVVDNGAQTTKIYIQGGAFEVQTELAYADTTSTFNYRRPLANESIKAFWGHTFDEASYYIDHLWIDTTGANLANPVPPPSTLQISGLNPASGALFHPADAGLTFTVSTGEDKIIQSENIELRLNGLTIPQGELTITGSTPSFSVLYDGLEAGTVYSAEVIASDSDGQATLAWEFRTIQGAGEILVLEDRAPYQETNDAIQGLLAANSFTGALPESATVSRLTDAVSSTHSQASVIPGPDASTVALTWDLGGTAEEIETRRLDRIALWIAGHDHWRTGYDGDFSVSKDGVSFTVVSGSRYATALTYTGAAEVPEYPAGGTGTNQFNLVSYKFDPGLTGGFRYLRFTSYGYDNLDEGVLRQPRLVEIDAVTTVGPIVREVASMPFAWDFGTVRLLSVLPQTQGVYELGVATVGAMPFVDEEETIVSLPQALEGKLMLRTANAEARWLAEGTSEVEWRYVDAIPDLDPDGNPMAGANTTLADGSGLFQPDPNAGSGPSWNWRPFGIDGFVLQGLGSGENTRELATTISGLEPFAEVGVSAFFWTDPGNWGLRGGLEYGNDANGNTWYDKNSPETSLASTLPWTGEVPLFLDGNRISYSVFLGNAVADESGAISIFIDDLPGGAGTRTFYDGVAFADTAVHNDGLYLAFEVDRDTTLYIANDPSSEPAWLTGHYTKTGMTIQTTAGAFDVWERPLAAREQVVLPGNAGAAGDKNLWVILGSGPGEIADSGDAQLLPSPYSEWAQDRHAWQLQQDPAAPLHTASLTAEVANFHPANGFRVEAGFRVPRLQQAGEHSYGFKLLGKGDDFVQAEWLPGQDGGGSTIRFVDTSTGTVLDEKPWGGLTPAAVNNDVGLVGGGEEIFVAGAPYFQDQLYFFDDFEDAAASSASWTSGGTNNIWEVGPPTDEPNSAHDGANVFGTDLDSSFIATTDAWLRSPVIDLTGVESVALTFWEYLHLDSNEFFHSATVSVLDAGTMDVLEELAVYAGQSDGWRFREYPLSASLGKEVILEFRVVTDADFWIPGWFIDSVQVGFDSVEAGFEITEIPAALASDGALTGVRTLPQATDLPLQFTVEDRAANGGNGVTVYVAWDVRNSGLEPDWLRTDFTRTDHFVGVSSGAGQHRLWAREYSSGEQVTLGGAAAVGGGPFPADTHNYFVLLGDIRPGLESFYVVEAEGIRVDGTWEISFTLSDDTAFSETLQTTLVQELDGRNEFGVVARYLAAEGALDSPLWETFSLSMDFLKAPVSSGFVDWRQQHFTAPGQLEDPAISGPDAAPAGDGVPNLFKYALGLLPWVAVSSEDLPRMEIDEQGRLILVYWERTDINDIDYIPEVSQNLTDWQSGPGNVVEIFREAVEAHIEDVGVRGELSGEARRGFIRLRVELRN